MALDVQQADFARLERPIQALPVLEVGLQLDVRLHGVMEDGCLLL